MKRKAGWMYSMIYAGTYLYLALPVMIFCIGWCRWYIGIPAAAAVAAAVVCCLKEHRNEIHTLDMEKEDWMRAAAVILLILLWAGLSGVGGYVWQNTDHTYRNAMFHLLVEKKWPLIKEIAAEGGLQGRGVVYYIGSWLPAAVVGKLSGFSAGRAALYLWTAAGILLMYGQICIWRKKVSVWPLVLFILFSAPDVLGVLLGTSDTLQIFGDQHLEWWPLYYQFSSITTQLFWVYNQAVPAWMLSALIFLDGKPRNMIFLSSLIILTSTLPFLGLLPYLIYFMVQKTVWVKDSWSVRQLLVQCWNNWGSIQNVAGGGAAALVSVIYLSGNASLRESMRVLNSEHRIWIFLGGLVLAAAVFYAAAVFAMKGWGQRLWQSAAAIGIAAAVLRIFKLPYEEWQSPVFYWINLTFFYAVEAGACLYLLYPMVADKKLFALNSIWLYVIPLILVGHSNDFCMRASIPGLFLMVLWCMHAADTGIWKKYACRAALLAVLLAMGAVTPLHEMKRSFVNTRSYYENTAVEEDSVFTGRNFSGSTKGVFWRYIAKQ